MSLRLTLKRQGTVRNRRWIIKRDTDNNIKEVKCIFNPHEYEKYENAKPMVGDRQLLKILDNEKEKNNS